MELAWFKLLTFTKKSTVRAVFPRASLCVRKKDMSDDWISSVGSHASSIISRKEQGKTGKSFTCKYCNHSVSGASRFAAHLAFKKSDVKACALQEGSSATTSSSGVSSMQQR